MSDYIKNLERIRTNPNLIIGQVLDDLEAQVAGRGSYDIPDGSHPFVWAVENGIMMATMAMSEVKSTTRRLYPNNAITAEDVYLHMSDDDYLNRFANPASTHFEFFFNKDEMLARMLPVGDTGMRKVVIPRLTAISVAGHDFTMQYPIEIRQMRHGGLQVIYDLDSLSPIQTLDTNQVQHKELVINRKKYLWLRVPIYQIKLNTYIETLNPSLSFEATFSFTDQFYHVRAYISKNGGWSEINTTHTDQVFNPSELTLVLKVANGKVHAEFPLIYTTTGQAVGELRLDLYTTKGLIDIDLGSYQQSNFTVDFNTIDDDPTYTNPLNHIGEAMVMNPNRVSGGSNATDFETLRNNVVDGVIGSNKLPITDVQLESFITRRGYELVSNIDNLTERQFLASRRLPPATNQSVVSAAGTLMGQVQLTMEQIASSEHVADNGNRLTILPTMLYNQVNGVITPVTDGQITSLNQSSPETLTRTVIENRFVYTPFHYVLDATAANFDVRPYYFGKPSIIRKTFVGDNDSSQIQANIDTYQIERLANGFRITVKLKSDDQFKQVSDELVVVQMGYRPVGETNYASVNGTLIATENNERIYQFDLITNWDVNSDNSLYTTNMSMYDLTQVNFALGMEHDLDFTILIDSVQSPGYTANELDSMVQRHLLSHTYMSLVRERLTVRLGYELVDLWRRNRTIIGPESYLTHIADVPALYETNIYARDAEGQIIIDVDADGNLQYELLHAVGDPVLDTEGLPVLKYKAGDTILDGNGKPTLVAPRKIMREFTLFLIDGLYYFASEASSVSYREEIPMQVVTWVLGDIALIRKQLLENCKIFFCPTTTFGNTTATVKEGLLADVTLDQGLNVTFYLDATNYRNTALRPNVIETTKRVITEQLNGTRVVRSDIVSALKLALGDVIGGIEVAGLGGNADFGILTLEDDAVRLSLRKKLTILTNQELMVEDDLNINFLRH